MAVALFGKGARFAKYFLALCVVDAAFAGRETHKHGDSVRSKFLTDAASDQAHGTNLRVVRHAAQGLHVAAPSLGSLASGRQITLDSPEADGSDQTWSAAPGSAAFGGLAQSAGGESAVEVRSETAVPSEEPEGGSAGGGASQAGPYTGSVLSHWKVHALLAVIVFFHLVWFVLYFASGKHMAVDSETDGFAEFERKNVKELHRKIEISRWTLRFQDDAQELRFIQVRNPSLNQRAIILCIVMIVYVFCHTSITIDTKGDVVLVPVYGKALERPDAFIYLVSTASNLVMSVFILFCAMQLKSFRKSPKLEYMVVWYILVEVFLICVTGSHWFAPKIFHLDPQTLFGTFSAIGQDVAWAFFVLYLTLSPVRFFICGPIFILLPTVYAILVMIWGSPLHPTVDTRSISPFNLLSLTCEAIGGLCAISFFTSTGKYINELQERIGFMSRLNSFNIIQELSVPAKEAGLAPVDKARNALNLASTNLEVALAETQNDGVEKAKAQVDFALRMMTNVSKFFEVQVEDLLRNSDLEGDSKEYAAFLIQDDTASMTTLSTTVPRLKGLSLKQCRLTRLTETEEDSFAVKDVAVICKGWGESWDFNALPLARATGGCSLIFAAEHAFFSTGAASELNIDDVCIRSWVREIHCRYTDVAYHNEAHAAQVAHFSYWFAKQTGLLQMASPFQMCALLIAAIGHDVGHFARTSLFLAKTQHAVSLMWNDMSILENMHSAITLSLIQDAEVLDCVDAPTRSMMRNAIIRFILATDVKMHASAMSKLKAMMEDTSFLASGEEAKAEEEVLIAGEFIMRTADIAHCMLPWGAHREWSYRVQAEFFEQGDVEKKLGVSVSPLCERHSCNIAGGQGFFIDHFGAGLGTVMLQFAKRIDLDDKNGGQEALQQCMDIGQTNKDLWKEEAKVFDALVVSTSFVQKMSGADVEDVAFPYPFAKASFLVKRVCEDNLAYLASNKGMVHERSTM